MILKIQLSFSVFLRSIQTVIYQTWNAMLKLKQILLLGCVWGLILVCTGTAQSQIDRISITERGDGNGYVLRYHVSEMVDSYDLIQPENDRVQMQLFSSGLDTAGILRPELNDEIISVELHSINGGIGVDITTAPNIFVQAEAYPDQNMRDLLVNLEYVSQAEVLAITRESDLFEWSIPEEPQPVVEEASETTEEDEPEPADQQEMEADDEPTSPVVRRESASVKIGIAGGIGIANKLGGNYTAESRQEFVMGISAGISLPFRLPFNLEPGIETGVFFVQKGFLNPSTDQFNGTSVLLDYVEVPVLARLRYDFMERVKPKAVGGFYTAFRANAESIEPDGDRNDLNDKTKSVDIGLMAGAGVDLLVQETNLSFQVRYGVGLPPLFPGDFSGNERPGYLSLLMAIRF